MPAGSDILPERKAYFKTFLELLFTGYDAIRNLSIIVSVFVRVTRVSKYDTASRFTEASRPASLYEPSVGFPRSP